VYLKGRTLVIYDISEKNDYPK